jgi:hypothetical protein
MFAVTVHAGPDALKHTDIAQHALEVLGTAGHLKRVVVAGRRGHIQVNHYYATYI